MTIGPLVPGVPTTVTPDTSPAIYTSTQGPAPDGPVVADDVLAVHQIALNVQRNLDARASALENITPGISTLTTMKAYPPISGGTTNTDWALSGSTSSGAIYWVQANSTTQPVLCELSSHLPPSGRILTIGAWIVPQTGHTGLPATLPTITISRALRLDPSTYEDVLTATQTAATYAAYEAGRFFSATLGTAHTIDHNYLYYFRFTGESGANFVGGLRVYGVELRITP